MKLLKTLLTIIPLLSATFFLPGCTEGSPAETTSPDEEQMENPGASLREDGADSSFDWSEEVRMSALDKGLSIVAAAFAALNGRLAAAIEKEGVPGAIGYCNLVALPLLDSLAEVHGVSGIRRVSSKVRNPIDIPAGWEIAALNDYEKAEAEGRELKPFAKRLDANTIAFAAPIRVLPNCMKCHGAVGQDIAGSDYEKILALYPRDQAVNYKEGELRGMWSIISRE